MASSTDSGILFKFVIDLIEHYSFLLFFSSLGDIIQSCVSYFLAFREREKNVRHETMVRVVLISMLQLDSESVVFVELTKPNIFSQKRLPKSTRFLTNQLSSSKEPFLILKLLSQ